MGAGEIRSSLSNYQPLCYHRTAPSSGVVDTSVYPPSHGAKQQRRDDDSRWTGQPAKRKDDDSRWTGQPSKRSPPKFSAIINEYVGACIEDHCTIGKTPTKSKIKKL